MVFTNSILYLFKYIVYIHSFFKNQLNSIEQATDIEPLMKTIENAWKKMPTSSNAWLLWKPVDMWMNKMPTLIAMKDEMIRMAPKIFNLERSGNNCSFFFPFFFFVFT